MPLLTEPKELRLPAIRTEETKAAFDGYVDSLGWKLTRTDRAGGRTDISYSLGKGDKVCALPTCCAACYSSPGRLRPAHSLYYSLHLYFAHALKSARWPRPLCSAARSC